MMNKVNNWILARTKGLQADEIRQLYATVLLIVGSASVHIFMFAVRFVRHDVIWFDICSLLVYTILSGVLIKRRYSLCITIISWEIFLYAILTNLYLKEIAGLIYTLVCFQIQLVIVSYKWSRNLLLFLSPIAAVLLFFRDAYTSISSDDPYILSFSVLTIFISLLLLARVEQQTEDLLAQRRGAEKAELEQGAYHDQLTGLYNRRWLQEMVPSLANQNKPFCVAMLDIDHFKKVNDNFGHDTGDIVLKRFADIISGAVRSEDSVFRYGGEEFLVLFETHSTDICRAALMRMAQALTADTQLLDVLNKKPITFSGGLTMVDWQDFEGSVSKSDMLLYTAKNTGRNRVCS
ncbi:GGDEF domain-containing protein [Lachnospiraceae bacterium ZAX-1]